jgi:hypothetical protein
VAVSAERTCAGVLGESGIADVFLNFFFFAVTEGTNNADRIFFIGTRGGIPENSPFRAYS